jgi:hypothetical protein
MLSTRPTAPSASDRAQTIVRTYKGNQNVATLAFQKDAAVLAAQGYRPTTQTWAAGSYGCAMFLGALVLCLVLIGFIVFIYMLIVPPPGTLTVTYELRQNADAEKVCPRCAERVKAAAIACRFCGYEFAAKEQPQGGNHLSS